MSQRTKVLITELLALPASDRQNIVKRLIKSLTPSDDEAAFVAELDRRWEDVISGKAKLIPREELQKRKKALR